MPENIDLAVWIPVGLAVISALWATWRTRFERAETSLAEHATETDKRLDDLTTRLATVEEWQRSAPNSESLSKIYNRIDGLSETLHEIKGGHETVNNLMKLVVQAAFRDASK